MRNINDFRKTKLAMTNKEYEEKYGDDSLEADHVLVYCDGLHIEYDTEEFEYFLTIERSSYTSDKLHILEERLWDDFAKWEMQVKQEDIEEDLHERARELMDDLGGYTCSLDEIIMMTLDIEGRERVQYLLDAFNEASERRTFIPEKRECWIINGNAAWVLKVDKQVINFQGGHNADYFAKHYESLGYDVTIENKF